MENFVEEKQKREEFKMAVVAMKQLLEAGVHFGHQTRRWDPKMAEYIFQARNGIHIIDLQKTSKKLDEAYSFVKEQAEEGKTVLFVGTKKQAQECIKEAAEKCNMYYVDQRWLGGMLTNFDTIQSRVKRLEDLETMEQDGTFEVLPKKEVILLKKEMEKLKIAIVGCGGIANQKHMPSIRANAEKAEMVAFCDIIPERAQKAAEEYGTPDAKVYTDYKAMLADHEIEIDVVHVCTPNVAHCPITVAAFEAGKHVMCEKPMAHNTADARKMIEAWKKSGKKFTIGYQNRLRDDTQTLHASCENRELGEIYFAKAHALRRRAVPTWGVFPNKALQGGGPLIDIGTHALDITCLLYTSDAADE